MADLRKRVLFLACLACIYELTESSICTGLECHRNYHLLPNKKHCGRISRDNGASRIMGGVESQIQSHPWLALIGYLQPGFVGSVTYNCAGSLITTQYVLTAARCVVFPENNFIVYHVLLGEHDIYQEFDCAADGKTCNKKPVQATPETIAYHRFYDPNTYENDIALIRLRHSIRPSSYISPICVPKPIWKTWMPEDSLMTISGWGNTDIENKIESHVAREVHVPVVSISRCIKAFPNYKVNEPNQICAGERGKDFCRKDNGGPLAASVSIDGDHNRTIIFGLMSVGHLYCGGGMPSLYTNVSAYMEWILDNIGA